MNRTHYVWEKEGGVKMENKNILPEDAKKAFRSPITPIIISSASVSLNFGFPSTYTAIATTLIFAILALWLGDRLFNGMIRDKEHDVKGVYVALPAALLIMGVAWVFTYLATLWPAWEIIFMLFWFFLTILFIKFIFFGEEKLERRAWLQAGFFAFIIGVIYIIAMYVASWVVLIFENLGVSQYWATAGSTLVFLLVLFALFWIDRKKVGEVGETFGEVADDLRDKDEYFGDLE